MTVLLVGAGVGPVGGAQGAELRGGRSGADHRRCDRSVGRVGHSSGAMAVETLEFELEIFGVESTDAHLCVVPTADAELLGLPALAIPAVGRWPARRTRYPSKGAV